MRFDCYTDRPKTRLHLYRMSGSGTTVTNKQGYNDAKFALASSAFTITPGRPTRTAPFMFGSVGTSLAGGICTFSSVGIGSQIATTKNSSNSAADGLVNVLAAGWDTNLAKGITQPSLPIVSNLAVGLAVIHVQGTSTPAIIQAKTRATLVKNTTGDYTVTLREPLASAESVVFAQAIGATCAVAQVDITNRNTLACKTYNASGSAVDADFYIFLFRPISRVAFGHARRFLDGTQAGMKVLFFQLDISGGTPALTYGPKGATVADNGVGDTTITLPSRMWSKRNPIVLLGGGIKNTVKAVSASTVRVASFDATGSALDPTVPVWGMIVTFGKTSEAW